MRTILTNFLWNRTVNKAIVRNSMNMNRKRSLKLVKAARKRCRTRSQSQNINLDLDQLVEERKEEKRRALKKKLQEKLKTIRDRRVSGVNSEPFPEGTVELLESNNIWEEVLGYLTEPADVTSSYHTCPTFAEILEGRRKLMMLPKALSAFKDKVGPKSYPTLWRVWRTVCLNARGVSKAWKEIGESQLLHSTYSKEGFNWFPSSHEVDLDLCPFYGEECVDQATSFLSSDTASSVVRNVQVFVKYMEPEKFERLYAKLLEFFKIHGQSVGYFHFEAYYSWNIGDDYDRLCEWLKYMPNLKVLHLSPYEIEDSEMEYGRDVEDENEDLQRRVNENPFPGLESLEHFGSNVAELNVSWLSQILRGCPNLKNVRFSRDQSITREIADTLKTLPLKRFGGAARVILRPRPCRNCDCNPDWPLKYLSISILWEFEKASILFPAINRFRETLEHLEIRGNSIKMDATANVQLDLPHLKYFCLRTSKPFRWEPSMSEFTLDDVLQLKTLEKMRVWSVEDEDENAKVKVKRHLENGEMEKSNVWQCFPNLMRFRIGWTAQEYERPSPTPP